MEPAATAGRSLSPHQFFSQREAAMAGRYLMPHQFPNQQSSPPPVNINMAPHQIFDWSGSRARDNGGPRPRPHVAWVPVEPRWYRNGGFGALPASSLAIARLPATSAGEAKEQDCSVCLEAFEESDELRTMPCSHAFHESCIFEWLRVSRLCPLCRFPLPTEQDEEGSVL